jgi:hypothetical protein
MARSLLARRASIARPQVSARTMGELDRWSKRLLPNLPYRRIQRASSFQDRIIIGTSTPRGIKYSSRLRPSSRSLRRAPVAPGFSPASSLSLQRALVAPGFSPASSVLALVFPQVRKPTIPPSLFESRSIENDAYNFAESVVLSVAGSLREVAVQSPITRLGGSYNRQSRPESAIAPILAQPVTRNGVYS